VQALYLMKPPPVPSGRDMMSALAFAVKNGARPAGMALFGLPCHLTGTGMAFPWGLVTAELFDSGNIVEDMQLGVDFAVSGQPPLYCELVTVHGTLPQQGSAARSQRTRWEHGHLQTMLTQMPKLLFLGLLRGRPALIGLALDMTIPPLSLLVMTVLAVCIAGVACGLLGCPWLGAEVAGVALLCLTVGVLAGWWRTARPFIPLRSLLAVPFYVLWKVPIYLGFLLKRQKAWVRTERDGGE